MPDLVEFPCPNCSSELNYDAEKHNLKCLHCHTVFAIEKSNELINEISLDSAYKNNAAEKDIVDINYKCSKCGQENVSTSNIVFFECKSCGNNVINTQAYKNNIIHPSSIIPFEVSKNNAIEIFKAWIGKGFWNESALKDLSLIESLSGSYIPFWTFDADTHNEWSGDAGYHYYETETYTDSNGQTQTRSVQRTRWVYLSGNFSHFFDDILICGNKEIAQSYINNVYPYNLTALVPLNEKFILGWNAKNYSQNIEDSFIVAKTYIDNAVQGMASDELGGDVQSGLSVDTTITNKTYKHIVLPVWFCEYLYKGKKYSFIINGQTGKIDGSKPLSATKIVIAVLLAIAIIVVIYFIVNNS